MSSSFRTIDPNDHSKHQDFFMNCLAFEQDYEEWINWGSEPNKLEKIDIESKKAEKTMKKLSELVISGYVRSIGERGRTPQVIEKIMVIYWKPPVSGYEIISRYAAATQTPMTSDEDAPEWPDDYDKK